MINKINKIDCIAEIDQLIKEYEEVSKVKSQDLLTEGWFIQLLKKLFTKKPKSIYLDVLKGETCDDICKNFIGDEKEACLTECLMKLNIRKIELYEKIIVKECPSQEDPIACKREGYDLIKKLKHEIEKLKIKRKYLYRAINKSDTEREIRKELASRGEHMRIVDLDEDL